MPERTSYDAGTPCWVELSSPDLDRSIEFYGALLGWEVPESENAEQTGGYRLAMKDGRPAAGMMPQMQEGQPTAWTTYVSVDDASATAAAVTDAAGTVLAEPMDVMDLGTMAVFADPTGAVFGAWQPGSFHGAGVLREPGAVAWNELTTRDLKAAKSFYGEVFGWAFEEKEFDRGAYTIISLEGEGFGGVTDRMPAELPNHWLVYFAVEDADATAALAVERGGSMYQEPFDMPGIGRIATVTDPWGASFSVAALDG